MSRTRSIKVSCVFPASPDKVWPMLSRVKTLQYIAAPYAYFKPLNSDDGTWREGDTLQFRFRVFGIIPMGIHNIHIYEMNQKAGRIISNESNRAVPVWNHTILLAPAGENTAHYTDIVEIEAGWMTGIVSLWSRMFYRHRQKKWIKMLSER